MLFRSADKTYIEPITIEILEKILIEEKPDAILPTMGGQTALNLAIEAEKTGLLRKYKIEIRVETDKGTETPSNQKEEPLSLEIRNFLDAIESKNELIVKPEHAVNVTRIAEAALLSSQKGIPIYLDIK